MSDIPLEYALIVFEGNKFSGKIAPGLLELVERGLVRFVDIAFIRKDKRGNIEMIELHELDEATHKHFRPFAKHASGLFTMGDLALAASTLPNNSSAALFLWENLWLEKVRKAVIAAGAVMMERGQIHPDVARKVRKELGVKPAKSSPAKKKTAGKTVRKVKK